MYIRFFFDRTYVFHPSFPRSGTKVKLAKRSFLISPLCCLVIRTICWILRSPSGRTSFPPCASWLMSAGEGQTISQPYTVACQSELLGNVSGKRVLEIGTGSGYQACILCEMGAKVFSIEYNRVLFSHAQRMLHSMGYTPHLFHGDGCAGKPAFAPYEAILVTAACPIVPPALISQLAQGGKLVLPLGERKIQHMVRITKQHNGDIKKERFASFTFVPLRGKDGWKT